MYKRGLVFFTIFSLLLTAACSSQEQAQPAEVKRVSVETVKQEQVSQMSELSAVLQPWEEAVISFEVGGRIVEMKHEEGDSVRAGDVLARVEDQDYELQVAASNAAVQQSAASLSKVQNGAREQEIAQAKLQVDKAQIAYQNAEDNFRRVEKLYQENAVSQSDFEQAQNGLNLARKDLENAEQAYSLVVQGARAEDQALTQAAYQQAVISRDAAATTLGKTQLRAPISGTILGKLSSSGNLVAAGTPVYRVGNIDLLKVILPVPDRQIADWQVGETIAFDLYGQTRNGQVVKIHPMTNASTGTIGVEVQIPNPQRDWFAGQVVKATKELDGKSGIFVPVEAVLSRGQGEPHVFLYMDGKAVKTSVQIGQIADNKLEIVNGLQVGDQVIVKGAERLFDGDTVEVTGGTTS
ncbi:efflux RND transporter periplasmic adaptor subunit [Brevibacillus sp. TJ4]|uniref:efflux RND transporter periplasmic adaptor subunit n=1 Tax=Brevibacillus sp. TJ4 TaxID=3234853 RepID=UPI0037D2D72A